MQTQAEHMDRCPPSKRPYTPPTVTLLSGTDLANTCYDAGFDAGWDAGIRRAVDFLSQRMQTSN